MARRTTTTILLGGILALGASGCGLPPGNGGGVCIDGQEADDPRQLSGSSFSTQTTRCIDPDSDEDVYLVDPSADGELSVTCSADADDAVHVEIDPSTGPTVDFACLEGDNTESVALTSTQTAQVTFFEGAAGVVDEGEGYQLTVAFD